MTSALWIRITRRLGIPKKLIAIDSTEGPRIGVLKRESQDMNATRKFFATYRSDLARRTRAVRRHLAMLRKTMPLLLVITVPIVTHAEEAKADRAIRAVKDLCLAGSQFDLRADASGNLTLFKLTPGGKGSASVNVRKSSGAAAIFDDKVRQVADEDIRSCIKPHIGRIIDAILLDAPSATAKRRVAVCAFTSIKGLGWSEGHKTNFCKNYGYPQGNYNPGKTYKDGGICMRGTEPNVCKAFVDGKFDPQIECTQEGKQTTCYRPE
jgi:hypothetical protein